MTQAIAIEKLTLHALKQKFDLQQSDDNRFFLEWQPPLPALSDFEKERLDRIKAVYENLEDRAVLERAVNIAIVGPLLDSVGLFLPPFYMETEKSVEIFATEEDTKLRGRLDILIIKDLLWVLTIESKQSGFSLKPGIPQLLAYMLAAPTAQQTLYGLVTNGSNFMFLKLSRHPNLIYARSKEFIINQDADLEQTLQVLKKLAGIAASTPTP